jgi:ATP-dependent Lon protease
MEVSLMIGREVSIKAIERALDSKSRLLLIISQRHSEQNDNLDVSQMYSIGTICKIEKAVRMEEAMKIFVVGLSRLKVSSIDEATGVRMIAGEEVKIINTAVAIPDAERSMITTLVRDWCGKSIRHTDPDLNRIVNSADINSFITNVMDIVSYRRPTATSPENDIINAAQKGLGQAYQENFDRHREAINCHVARRQSILEEVDLNRAVSLLRDILTQEVAEISNK